MSSAVATRRTPRASAMSSTSKVVISVAQLPGAWLQHVRLEHVEDTRRPVFGLELDVRADEMRHVGRMRLSDETRVHARPLEAGLLEERGQLVFIGIDESVDHDEIVDVRGRLASLDRIGFRSRCVLGRKESPLDREGCDVVSTVARDERYRRHRHEGRGLRKRTATDARRSGSSLQAREPFGDATQFRARFRLR